VKYFSSAISGKTIGDFQQYDASLTRYSDRLDLVTGMINDDDGNLHEFFATYFGEYYDVNPTQKGWMAEQDAVCKAVEGLGTYLLNSKDIDSNRKIKYRFWKSEKEFKQYKESENVNTSTLETGVEEGTNVIDMFYSPDDKNFKLANNNKVYARDIKDIKEVRILQDAIETAKQECFVKSVEKKIDSILPIIEDIKIKARLNRIRGNVQNYVGQWISDMRENQIAIKVAVKRPIKFKNPLKDEGAPDKLEDFDFMEKIEVATLLPFISSTDLMTEIGTLAYDLNNLLDGAKLSTREMEIVELFREGYSSKEVQEELGIKKQNMKTYIDRIAEKVVKIYEIQLSDFRENKRQKLVK
jgi:predicted DNA-binding protein YlxM (UPF0122 family)